MLFNQLHLQCLMYVCQSPQLARYVCSKLRNSSTLLAGLSPCVPTHTQTLSTILSVPNITREVMYQGLPAFPHHKQQLECIHGILTLHASLYVARSIPPVFSCMGVWVSLLTVTTTCDFERGGATKPIIGSSWNNGVKNRLDLYQVQKRPYMIMLIVFRWLRHL